MARTMDEILDAIDTVETYLADLMAAQEALEEAEGYIRDAIQHGASSSELTEPMARLLHMTKRNVEEAQDKLEALYEEKRKKEEYWG